MADIVVVDFDGTLCDTDQIKHLFGDWEMFHTASFDCPPRIGVVELCRRLQHSCRVLVVTGKPEKWRAKTLNWLSMQGLIPDALLMRPMGNDMPDAQLKPQLVIDYQGNLISVICAIEDRDKMVDAWRALGVICLQAAPCMETKLRKERQSVG